MIDTTYFWVNIFVLAAGTLMIRSSIIAFSNQISINARAKELFTFIPAAILPAFIAPAIFFHRGEVGWLAGKERLAVLILAGVVCYFIRNTLVTIVFGLVALYFLTAF